LKHRDERHGLSRERAAWTLACPTGSREVHPMSWFFDVASRFQRDETGASLAEYALLLALIAIVCLAGMTILGSQISNLMTTIYSTV